MKKVIFTLLSFLALHITNAQTTYYWIGGTTGTSFTSNANWNTGVGGTGTVRAAAANNDILIFDGYDVSSDPGQQTGTVSIAFTGTIITGQILLKNNADVVFSRSSSGGTTLVTAAGTGDNDPDFLVQAGSKFTIGGNTGSMGVVIGAAATGEVYGDVIFADNGANTTNQNRLVALAKGTLVFMAGSTVTTTANYGYNPFGTTSSGTSPAAPAGIIFRAGSTFSYGGGSSPFGSASASLIDFQTGSTFIFTKAPTGVTNIWSNRAYPNVIIRNSTTVNPDATFIKIDTLTIETGSGFLTNTSGSTPINGNIINNGTFAVPPADPNRGNKLLMINSVLQSLSGTGTYNVGYFVISNVSNVALQRTVTVDTSTIIFGKLSPNGFLAGPGTVVNRAPQTYSVTGNTNADSFVVKNISSFTGIEPGMSVTGTGIPANTVVVSTSIANATITLSKPVTGNSTYGGSAASLTVLNGQGVLPIRFGDISANLQNGQTKLVWKILTENNISRYIIERSTNAIRYVEVGSVTASGSKQYNWNDLQPAPGANYYRIKAIGNDGEILYSIVLRVNSAMVNAEMVISPNPVVGNDVNLSLINLEKGTYTLNLFNQLGQKSFSKILTHSGGSINQIITLPSSVSAGLYNLQIIGESNRLQQALLVK